MKLYRLIWLFIALYPFLIWPWGAHMDVFLPKAEYLTLFTLSLWGCFFWRIWKYKFRPRLHAAHWLLLALAALITVATIFSLDPVLSLTGMQGRNEGLWAWYSYITLFICSSFVINKQNYRRLIDAFVLGGWLVSIYGILQHFSLDFLPRSFYHIDHFRSWGFFDNSNYFGTYLVLVLTAGVTLYLATRNAKYLIALYAANITAFAAMIYSGSRAAWLATAVGLAVCTILIRRDINWKRYGVLLASFLLVFALIIITEQGRYLPRLVSLFIDPINALAGDASAGAGRWGIWVRSVPLIRDYFWLGSGPDTFFLICPGRAFNAHNLYLQLALTTGVPAAFAYISCLAAVLARGLKQAQLLTAPRTRILRYGLLATCLAYSVKMLFNNSVIVVAPFFWVLLAACYALALDKESPAPSKAELNKA